MIDAIAEKFIRLELTPLLADEWVDMIPERQMIVFPEYEPHAFYDKLSEGVLPKLPPDVARRLKSQRLPHALTQTAPTGAVSLNAAIDCHIYRACDIS